MWGATMRSRLFLALIAAGSFGVGVRAADDDKIAWAFSTPQRPPLH